VCPAIVRRLLSFVITPSCHVLVLRPWPGLPARTGGDESRRTRIVALGVAGYALAIAAALAYSPAAAP